MKARMPAALAAMLLSAAATAQNLPDPTRPPDAPLAGSDSGAVGTRAAPRLQSVLVSSNGRRVAVIDGRTVRVGDTVGQASVTGIGDTSVTLRRGKSIDTIRLYPKNAEQDHAGKKQVYAH